MRRAPFVLPFITTLAVLSLMGVALPAAAQDRLFVGTAELGAFGHFGERLGPAPDAVYGEFAGGGRYLARDRQAIDTRSGEVITLPGDLVGVDPRQPRVFVHDGMTLSIFDFRSRTLSPLGELTPLRPFDPIVARVRLATDADELVVLQRLPEGFVTPGEFSVIDIETRVVRRFAFASPGPFELVTDWSVTSDGRRLVVLTIGLVSLVDSQSGAVLAQQRPPSGWATGSGNLIDDRVHRRWYVRHQHQLTVLDDDLRLLAELPLRSNCAQSAVTFSPHTRRVYIAESEGGSQFYGQPIPITHFLSVYDAATGRRLDAREITQAAGVPAGSNSCAALPMAVVTAPGAPQALAAGVVGRDVTLSWTNVGDASQFVLDVGLTPGRADFTFGIGAASPVSFAGVPPGTYYLRVRGTNEFGVSRPSGEVTLVVP